MKQLIYISLCVLSISFSKPLYAGHIIGADMTYRCLGNGDYEVTLKVYRDCFCVGCADFDATANFAIYECGFNTSCFMLDQTQALYSLNVPLSQRTSVPAPEYECQETPPFLCVEQGLYIFKLSDFNITLPNTTETYNIVYQRCCRNETINNIIQPRASGATYFVELTPASYAGCNNSPVYKEFPPTVICANLPLEFDHSATDADGDSLSYRFCAPLLGGGLRGSAELMGSQFVCDGITPTPACPPPFDPVVFSPQFSALFPMRGNPVVSIDPITGLISGTPEIIGQFVVGVCVDEWRNGQILGTTKRDFQFNTSGCSPTVIADIEAEIVNGQRYFLKSCGSNTVEFVNNSSQEVYIKEYTWIFEQGEPRISKDRNASVTFPDTGRYTGILILNPGLICSDSLEIILDIFPEISAEFDFDFDQCDPGDVTFTDESVSGSGQIVSWDWSLNQNVNLNTQNPIYRYQEPGEYDIELIVEDINTCRDSITKTILYFPAPETIIVEPDKSIVCLPGQVNFFNLSEPINDQYIVVWDFGDGNTGNGLNITHEYAEPGNYNVIVTITSPLGCTISATFNSLVTAFPGPIADFDFNPQELHTFQKTTNFRDLSTDAAFWNWYFGTEGTSSLQHPVYTFPDTGTYPVTLIVTHQNGCMDTIIKYIDVEPRVKYFLPNAFTPNGDGLNDLYMGAGIMDGATEFNFTIWNRWGELIFETDNPGEGWNGSKENIGTQVQPGVYVCVVQYRDPRGNKVELKGFATLVR